jgi:hypothetical protein
MLVVYTLNVRSQGKTILEDVSVSVNVVSCHYCILTLLFIHQLPNENLLSCDIYAEDHHSPQSYRPTVLSYSSILILSLDMPGISTITLSVVTTSIMGPNLSCNFRSESSSWSFDITKFAYFRFTVSRDLRSYNNNRT